MRLWLKDSERRPDPTPVKTDDRKAILVGMALWVVALIVMVMFAGTLADTGRSWWLLTCAIALGLGLIGLIYTHRHHR